MLGGSVCIAFIRFGISLAGVILLFSLLSESRFGRKKTMVCYSCFCVALIALACVWYVVDWESCVRMVAFAMYICFGVFAIIMSRDSVYLAVYKLALIFYLMSVFLIGGLEISIIFFNRNVWADIIARILLILLISFLLNKYVKESMKGFGDYVENEADHFSVAVMIICILFGIGYILNPTLNKEMTPHRIYQVLINFILTGTLQLLVFRVYLHVGKEKEYEREKQLIQMNYRLLERQLEILEESVDSGRRLRHDIRHHNAVMAEYARRGQCEELLQYLQEYDRETDQGIPEMICANPAVNNILSAYTRKAENERIKVNLDVELGRNLAIPSIDLVAILANAYENAIYACMEVMKQPDGRECFIHLILKKRKNKLIISCSNTCRMEIELKNGQPKTEFTGGIGVSSIIRTVEKYAGKYDFKNDNGVFVLRLIMNIEPENKTGVKTSEWRADDVSDSTL
ncbi:MAG: GHKL domain-containing protein [Lachnospiraceae bacterium]|nr:GHKL domain-containing protein [Lachnospiraceae bacterium]